MREYHLLAFGNSVAHPYGKRSGCNKLRARIADHLNAKKTVVLNLEAANRDVSRRIIDFLSGVAYANNGNIRKVANSTFIIVPTDVDVMGELMLDDIDDGKMYF